MALLQWFKDVRITATTILLFFSLVVPKGLLEIKPSCQ